MNLSGKSYLLLAAGLVVGAAAAAQSFAIANERRAPTRTLMLGMPFNGVADASMANLLQAARVAKGPQSAPSKAEIKHAREALASEPLATSALPILIQEAEAEGRAKQARRLLDLSGGLTRRDNLINAMLIDEAMKTEGSSRVFLLLGRAIAVDYKVRDLYVGRMAAATGSPGALNALPPVLGRDPEWATEYWATIAGNNALVLDGAKVRLRIAGAPWKLNKPDETDFRLIRELANLDPDAALQLSQALGLRRSSTGDILANPNFIQKPRFVPLDWELFQSGDIGADIDRAAGRLVLSSLPAASGVAARQLVNIAAPGRYRLQWKLLGLATGADGTLKFRLACADQSKVAVSMVPVLLAPGTGGAAIDVRSSTCSWYWATLELDTSNSAAGVDVEVRQLSLRREGAASGASRPAESQN